MALLKYEEIAESLRARIAADEFPPGERVPSGRDLAEQWQVSRATAVKALDVLRDDGIVQAQQGSGFIVAPSPIGRAAGNRKSGSARATGGMPFTRVGTPDRIVPPPRVTTALGMPNDAVALRRVRVMQLPDGSPHSRVVAWFPSTIADQSPRLEQNSPITEGTTRYVRRQTGRFPVEGHDVATVRLATEDESEALDLPSPSAVAVVLHTAYDQAGQALVCEEGVTPEALWEQEQTYSM